MKGNKYLVEGPGCTGESCVNNITSIEWAYRSPSLLVWADEIMLSDIDYEAIMNRRAHREGSQFEETLASLIEILKAEGIVQVFDAKKTIPQISLDSVRQQVLTDLSRYGGVLSEDEASDKNTPQEIVTPEGHFCGVILESMYTSLLLSRILGCTCVMDKNKASFAFSRFGNAYPMHSGAGEVFDELYSIVLPELDLHNGYRLFCSDATMQKCAHGERCANEAKANLRRFIDDVLFMRDNECIAGLKDLTRRIELERGPETETIRRAVLSDIRRANHRVESTYSSIKAWTKYIASCSAIAVSAMSASPSEALIPVGGIAATAGLANTIISRLEKKEEWKLLFREKMEASRLNESKHHNLN